MLIKVTYLAAFLIVLIMACIVDGFALDACNAMWLGLTEVPLAPIFAAVLFGEVMTANTIFGGVLIIGAALAHTITASLNNAKGTA